MGPSGNNNNELHTQCPTCGKKVLYEAGETNQHFPFCSKRCKLTDLGKWFEEDHRIEGSLNDRMPEGADGDKEEEQHDNIEDFSG